MFIHPFTPTHIPSLSTQRGDVDVSFILQALCEWSAKYLGFSFQLLCCSSFYTVVGPNPKCMSKFVWSLKYRSIIPLLLCRMNTHDSELTLCAETVLRAWTRRAVWGDDCLHRIQFLCFCLWSQVSLRHPESSPVSLHCTFLLTKAVKSKREREGFTNETVREQWMWRYFNVFDWDYFMQLI